MSPDEFDTTVGAVTAAAFTTDADGRIDSWSQEAEALFEEQAKDVIGLHLSTLFAVHPSPTVRKSDTGDGGMPVPWFERRNGTRFEARYRTVELRDATTVVGHVHLMDARTHATDKGDTVPGSAVAQAAPIGTQSDQLRYSEEARVGLLRRLVIAQEEERRRIARDLHDHLGQQLTSIRLKMEAIRHATTALPTVQSMVTQADALLSHIDRDIDFLSWELRPAALDDLGLMAVLDNYVREWSRHSDVPARFHAEGVAENRIAPEIEATLYRIAQEALNNVAKHAHARSVGVVLEQRGSTMSLLVEDDGIGCDASAASSTMVGFLSMRERATVVGGTLDIEPTAGGGTTILARVPLRLTDSDPSHVTATLSPSPGNANDFEHGGPRDSLLARRSPDRLQELQRAVAARDEFIATVAHELRNPIAPLMFQVRLSIDRAEQMDRAGESVSPDWARAQLRRIEQRLHRLLETLDRLLDVSRLASGRIDLEPENMDLVECVRDVLASFEAECAVARCEVRVTMPTTVTGWWDRLRLDQICRNLVSNAIRFGAGRAIHVTVEADEDTAILTVRDHGIGISPDKQDVIFERFERGPDATRSGGFGIGLWVVRNVCAAMGGSITVDSAVGGGAAFAVTLPRRPERDQRPEVTQ